MAIYDKEVGLIRSGHDGSAQPALEAPHDLGTDVRSTVESRFRQMEQAHDRIRVEELSARLAEHILD